MVIYLVYQVVTDKVSGYLACLVRWRILEKKGMSLTKIPALDLSDLIDYYILLAIVIPLNQQATPNIYIGLN